MAGPSFRIPVARAASEARSVSRMTYDLRRILESRYAVNASVGGGQTQQITSMLPVNNPAKKTLNAKERSCARRCNRLLARLGTRCQTRQRLTLLICSL